MADLRELASGFAQTMTRLVNGTFSREAQFEPAVLENEDVAWVWPVGSSVRRPAPIAVTAGLDAAEDPRLWVSARYQVRLDDQKEHLAVESSVFGLCINEAGRPAVRIEYERDKGNEPDDPKPGSHRRSAAHVQIHGASPELSYALAMTGQQPRALEKFHIPVGGRRYRPTLEDFVEFLHAERLLPALHDGWRDVVTETRGPWERAQLSAAVRNNPEIAAEQLKAMGWGVEPPS